MGDVICFKTRKVLSDDPVKPAYSSRPNCVSSLNDHLTLIDQDDDMDIQNTIVITPFLNDDGESKSSVCYFDWHLSKEQVIAALESAIETLRGQS